MSSQMRPYLASGRGAQKFERWRTPVLLRNKRSLTSANSQYLNDHSNLRTYMKLSDISLCSDSCVVGFYQWLLRCMSANANLSMDMRWAELAELAELGAEKEEKDIRTCGEFPVIRRLTGLRCRVFTLGGGGSGERCRCEATEADYHLIWIRWADGLGLTYIPKIPMSPGGWKKMFV